MTISRRPATGRRPIAACAAPLCARVLCLAALFLLLVPLALPAGADAAEVTALASSRRVVLSGFTRPRATLDLVAEEPGRVTRVAADIGDPIGSHGLFATVDDVFIRLDLENNRVQQARLASLIEYNEKEATRYRELVSRDTAAQATLDGLEQALDTSRFELDALQVAGRVLEERLARTRIPAPAGWRVMARDIEPGQWVGAGQVVGRAGDFSTLLVPFALTPEQFMALDRPKGALTLRLTDLGVDQPAAIRHVNPGFDPETRKIAVDLELTTESKNLRGGLRAELVLDMPEAEGVVLLPREAVEERYEDHWVIRADGSRVRVVLLGNHSGPDGTLVRVSGPGLSPGERFTLPGKE